MIDAPLARHRRDAAIGGDHTHLAQQGSLISRLRLGQRSLSRRARLDRIQAARPEAGSAMAWAATAPTPARAQGTLAPPANMAVCTATPSSPVCGSRATIEYVTVSPPDPGRRVSTSLPSGLSSSRPGQQAHRTEDTWRRHGDKMARRRIWQRLHAGRPDGIFPHRCAIVTAGHGLVLRPDLAAAPMGLPTGPPVAAAEDGACGLAAPARGPCPPGEQQVADHREGDTENHPRHQHEQVTGGHDRPLGLRTACRLNWTGPACAPGDAGVVTTWRTRGLPPRSGLRPSTGFR